MVYPQNRTALLKGLGDTAVKNADFVQGRTIVLIVLVFVFVQNGKVKVDEFSEISGREREREPSENNIFDL